MSDSLSRIREAQVDAAERAVIDGIPKELLVRLEEANAEFAAKGGCPGCGSKRIAVHTLPCKVLEKEGDLY